MGVALGRDEADEYRTNLSQLSVQLKGNVGLLFTKLGKDEVGLCLCPAAVKFLPGVWRLHRPFEVILMLA